MNVVKHEPAALQAIVRAGITMLVLFGLHLTEPQIAAVILFTELILGYWLRSRVTPVDSEGTPIHQDNFRLAPASSPNVIVNVPPSKSDPATP